MRRHLPRLTVAALLLLTAAGFLSSLALGWGAADAPDGTRFKVSPLGLSHVLTPHQTVSETEDCRWGEADALGLCTTRPEAVLATFALRAVPTIMRAGAIVALVGVVLWLVPAAQVSRFRYIATALPPALGLAALALFAWSVPESSRVLHGLAFGTGGTKATLQVAVLAAALLGFIATAIRSRRAAWRALQVACLGTGTAAWVLMFPLAGALAFAAGSFAAGAGVALLLHAGRPTTDAVPA